MGPITLLFAALFAVASWVTPSHSVPWLAFHAEFMMALALGVALWGELLQRPPNTAIPIAPLTIGTLGVAIIPLIQSATGLIRFAGDGWMAFVFLLGFALAQILGGRLTARWGQPAVVDALAGIFVTGAVLSVGLQLYQWLRLSGLGIFAAEVPPAGVPFANFAQPNHLATMLFLGLVGLLLLHQRGRIGAGGAALGTVFLESGMVMTGSRTAWLAITLLVVALWTIRSRLAPRLSSIAIPGLAVLFVALVAAWPAINDLLLLAPGRSLANQATAGPRPLFYSTMLDAAWHRPWWGYGWNQGLVAQSAVLDAHAAGGRLMGNSHNLVLDLLVWNGLPIATLITIGLAWWAWRQMQRCDSVTQFFLLVALGGAFVHAMLEYPLSYAYFLLPVGLMMGVLDAASAPRRQFAATRGSLIGLTAVGSVFLALITFEYAKVEANTEILRFEVARIGTHSIRSQAPDLLLLTQWRQYLRYARIDPEPGMTPADISQMKQVVERFPYSSLMRQYAVVNALNGEPHEASATLVRLCKLHSPTRCSAELFAWRELAQTRPELLAVPTPPVPAS